MPLFALYHLSALEILGWRCSKDHPYHFGPLIRDVLKVQSEHKFGPNCGCWRVFLNRLFFLFPREVKVIYSSSISTATIYDRFLYANNCP